MKPTTRRTRRVCPSLNSDHRLPGNQSLRRENDLILILPRRKVMRRRLITPARYFFRIILFINPLIADLCFPLAGPPSHRKRHNLTKSLGLSRTLSDSSTSRASNRHSSVSHRSILQQAWHVVTTVDAFYDSDEEDIDESARHAYAMRLQVLADFHQNAAGPHLPSSVTSNERHLISSSHA